MALRTARLDRDAIVLIVPRSKGSRNATSTTLHVCFCARTDCVSLEDGVTNPLDVAPRGHCSRWLRVGRPPMALDHLQGDYTSQTMKILFTI